MGFVLNVASRSVFDFRALTKTPSLATKQSNGSQLATSAGRFQHALFSLRGRSHGSLVSSVKSQAKRCFGRTLGRKIRILMGGKATRPLVRRRGRAQKSCGMHGRSRNGETPKEKGSDRSKDSSRSPDVLIGVAQRRVPKSNPRGKGAVTVRSKELSSTSDGLSTSVDGQIGCKLKDPEDRSATPRERAGTDRSKVRSSRGVDAKGAVTVRSKDPLSTSDGLSTSVDGQIGCKLKDPEERSATPRKVSNKVVNLGSSPIPHPHVCLLKVTSLTTSPAWTANPRPPRCKN
jgi:hypothetical protein